MDWAHRNPGKRPDGSRHQLHPESSKQTACMIRENKKYKNAMNTKEKENKGKGKINKIGKPYEGWWSLPWLETVIGRESDIVATESCNEWSHLARECGWNSCNPGYLTGMTKGQTENKKVKNGRQVGQIRGWIKTKTEIESSFSPELNQFILSD